MRLAPALISAFFIAGTPAIVAPALAQGSGPTRADEIPGNKPLAAFSPEQRAQAMEYMRGRSVPTMTYSERVTIGMRLPETMTFYRFENNPGLAAYRYTRLGNQIVILDDTGRVVDLNEAPAN